MSANGVVSAVAAVMLYAIMGIALTGALAYAGGMVADAAMKLNLLINYRRTRRMAFQDLLNKIAEADTAVSAAFERVGAVIQAAVANAAPPAQLAQATSKLQDIIDSANQVASSNAPAAPADPATPPATPPAP